MRTGWAATATLALMATIAGAPVSADTIDILATADGDVVVRGTPLSPIGGVINGAINVSQNVVPNEETRSIYEFDLPLLSAPIISATFLGSAVQNSAPPGLLNFFGFAGNGTVDTADATQVSTLVGNTSISAQLGSGALLPIAVSLSPSFVQGLGSGFLGLTTTVGTGDTVGIASLENNVPAVVNNPLFVRPTLRLVTEEGTPSVPVPEPGTILLLSSGLGALIVRARKELRGRVR